ncbi:hypothetical protein G9F73_006205 [Clostridium estertheticum]|uniref:hypothetical protein n=1 Tax=Clostridium estertheticum TaxID=238834 RepID=UPI0013EECBD1|nr:hypothetical protein [Clostridium estertheticum]MBZ9607414.1 hypothetical protein [Clostridium estertheticum]
MFAISNANWQEELVLQLRNLTIDKNIISRAMKNFVAAFNNNIDKYKIKNIQEFCYSKIPDITGAITSPFSRGAMIELDTPI